MLILILGVAIALVAAFIIWVAIGRDHGEDVADRPFDVEQMREKMLSSATTPQEREYLAELDALELHRRHLIC